MHLNKLPRITVSGPAFVQSICHLLPNTL